MQTEKLRKGAEHVKSAKGGSRKFTPSIYWKEDKESHFVLFISPVGEFTTLDVHVIEISPKVWRTFICRKEACFEDESGGHCPACDELGDSPSQRTLALAVELDPVEKRIGGRRTIESLKVKMVEVEKDGETKEYPRIGVVFQAAGNFFNYITAYDAQHQDVTTLAFEIQREGKGGRTNYQFFPLPGVEVPTIDDFEDDLPDVVAYIEELGSQERYDEELKGVKRESKQAEPAQVPDEVEPSEGETEEVEQNTFAALKARLEKNRTT